MKLGKLDGNSNLRRLNEIIKVLSKYEFGYITEKINLKNKIPFKSHSYQYESIEELDATIPLRLRLVLQELGTTYIKLGQALSTRPDLIGDDISNEFSKMQDDNPPVAYETIKSVLETELGDSLDNIFLEFNKEPLGSASIGQVHSAVLKNRNKVAVKIQKPGVDVLIKEDISIMRFLAKRIDNYIPQFRNYNFPGIVDEFERSILKEIDYNQEAMNITRFDYNFKEDETVYVPAVYKEYSTSKVLTMELIEGKKVADVINTDEGFDKPLIAKRGVESFFKQVLIHGFFHADPHPANIYVLDDNIICFLDYGMMGILDKEFRENLAELIIYFMENSVKGMINQLIYMGIINESIDIKSFKYELTDLMYRYYGIGLNEMHGGMNDLISLMRKYKIHLPREFVLLARGIGMLEDTGLNLDPSFNPVETFKPMALKVIQKRISPLGFMDFVKDNLFEVEHLIKTLPRSVSKTLYRLEEGKISIEIEHKDLERISNKVSTALIIAALLIGSSLIMQTDKGILILGFPFLGIIGFIISMILGLNLVLSILRHREL
ncbi:MAG: AarF/ABC1/UbiB kinase family protein [Methanobacterium sp.]|uniref:ABC1 kinase family protein n=1 Tax=Methanobacterium sp. TaxID=2164 RepID=UPI003D650424|nr:AarF/ABC1/UbiB kinase family protein [Methanobacterium sp.]